MADLGKLALLITADPTGFQAGLQKAVGQGEAFSSRIVGTFSNMGANVGAIWNTMLASPMGLAAFGLTQAWHAIVGLTEAANKASLEQDSLMRKFELTNLQAAGLQFQVRATGGSLDDVTGALRMFSMRLGETEFAGTGVSKALQRLGLSADQLRGMPVTEAVAMIGDAMRGVENATERAALAHTIFGRRAHDLNLILKQGSVGMRTAQMDAEHYGLTMGETAKKIREAELASKRAEAVLSSIFSGLGKDLAGSWAEFKINLAGLFMSTNEFQRMRNEARAAAQGEADETAEAARAAGRLSEAWHQVGEEIDKLNKRNPVQKLLREIESARDSLYLFRDRPELTPNNPFTEIFRREREAAEASIQANEQQIARLQAGNANRALNELVDQYNALTWAINRYGQAEAEVRRQQFRGELPGFVAGDPANDEVTRMARRLDWLRQIQQLTNASMSPLERFQEAFENINEAWNEGMLSAERYDQVVGQLTRQFVNAGGQGESRLAAGLQAGSAGAISAINRFNVQDTQDPAERLRLEIERQGRVQEDIRYWNRRTSEAISSGLLTTARF